MKPPQLIDCEQNTPEWHAARNGYITASGVAKLFTAKGDIANNATSRAYIASLARARIFGVPDREKGNRNFDRGHELEPIARAAYESHKGCEAKQTGFWVRDLTGEDHFLGASPDFLVGEDGIGEIKTRCESEQWGTIMSGEVPSDAVIQIQAELLAAGREWCHYVSFCDGMPLLVSTVQACPIWQERIKSAVVLGELAIRRAVEEYRLKSAGMMLTERIPDADELTTL